MELDAVLAQDGLPMGNDRGLPGGRVECTVWNARKKRGSRRMDGFLGA